MTNGYFIVFFSYCIFTILSLTFTVCLSCDWPIPRANGFLWLAASYGGDCFRTAPKSRVLSCPSCLPDVLAAGKSNDEGLVLILNHWRCGRWG